MRRYKYSKTEQEINDVLKFQANELNAIKNELPPTDEIDRRIQESKDLLIMLGHTEMPVAPTVTETKRVIAVPSWEDLLAEAVLYVGTGNNLESLFTEEELKRNQQEILQLNAEFNQLYKLDKYDVAICASAGILSGVIDGLKGGSLSNYVRDWFDKKFPEDEMEKLANSKVSKVPYDAQDNRNTTEYVQGLSAYYHRLLSLGHDPLLGLLFGVMDILAGRMTTIMLIEKSLMFLPLLQNR